MDTQEIARHAPGLLGAITATLWIKDTWPRRIAYVVAGAAASHYAAPQVAGWTGTDIALAGFLVGLFSMAVAAKVFETVESVKASDLVDRILRKVGL